MVLDESTKQLLTALATLIGIVWAAAIAGSAKKHTDSTRADLDDEVIYLRNEIKLWRASSQALADKLQDCMDNRLDDSHQQRPGGLKNVL